MLIDVFKETTNHLEGLSTVDDINEIRECLNNKIAKAKKRAADKLNLSNIEGIGEFIPVTLPSSKKLKTHKKNIINYLNNNLHKTSFGDDRLN